MASAGIESMAEVGGTGTLVREINAVSPTQSYRDNMNGNAGTVVLNFRVSEVCPLVTFVSMVAPSHDWFVGVSSLDLRSATTGEFEDRTVNLRVYDAGTENGHDFSFNGSPTSPQGVITRLTTSAADTDFNDGVHRTTGAFIGQFIFERVTSTAALPSAKALSAERLMLTEVAHTVTSQNLDKLTHRISQGKTADDQLSRIWSEGSYQILSDEVGGMDWQGDLLATRAGVDRKLSANLLAGLMASWQRGRFHYSLDAERGRQDLQLLTLQPYLNWSARGLDFWATTSYGRGALTIKDGRGQNQSRLSLYNFSLGASAIISQTNKNSLRLKSDFSYAKVAAGSIKSTGITQARLALVNTRDYLLAGGDTFKPGLQIGFQNRAGYGVTTNNAEIGATLVYSRAGGRLRLSGQSRLLLSARQHWQLGGTISLSPGAVGRGLSFHLQPEIGSLTGDRLFSSDDGFNDPVSETQFDTALNMRISYRFSPKHNRRTEPYASFSFIGDKLFNCHLGGQIRLFDDFSLQVESSCLLPEIHQTDLGVRLNIKMNLR